MEIAPDAENRDKDAIRLCRKDNVCFISDSAGDFFCFILLGSYFGNSSKRAPCNWGVLNNINKYDVGFSGDWGSLKCYVAKVGIPLSEWPLSGDLPNIVTDTVEKTGKFHLALYL